MAAPTGRGWPLFLTVAILAAAADLVSKAWIFASQGMPGQSTPVPVLAPWLVLETNLNEGALFGMGQGMGALFATVSVAAVIGIGALVARPSTREDNLLLAALGLIVGGILGNLYDRLGLPGLQWHAASGREGQPVLAVRDWIHFQIPGVLDWPIFNVADSWLVIGAAILLITSFMAGEPGAADEQSRP